MKVRVQDVLPETEVRTVLTGDGDDAARRGIAGRGEVANLGFRVRWGARSSPARRS
jgi:hypothetical protein